MPSESIIIYAQELDRADHNIIQLLDFLGIRYRTISLSNSSFDFDSLCQQLEETDACILVNCKTLGILLRDAKQIDSFRDFVGQQLSSMLVYNITPADHDIAVLNGLTGGHIQSVSSFNDNHYQYRISWAVIQKPGELPQGIKDTPSLGYLKNVAHDPLP